MYIVWHLILYTHTKMVLFKVTKKPVYNQQKSKQFVEMYVKIYTDFEGQDHTRRAHLQMWHPVCGSRPISVDYAGTLGGSLDLKRTICVSRRDMLRVSAVGEIFDILVSSMWLLNAVLHINLVRSYKVNTELSLT